MITNLLLPSGLAFIMFAIGLTLRFGDFRRVFEQPKGIVLGLFCQMALLPLAAFGLLLLWPLPPEFAVGIMILAACPGGITSNLLTHMARGDTALSISMTAVTSLAGAISVPLIVNIALIFFMDTYEAQSLPVWKMTAGVFAVSTLPVLLGVLLNQLHPALALRLERFMRPVSVIMFALIVIGAFASQWSAMMQHIGVIGPTIALLNAGIMAAGYKLAGASGLNRSQAIAISMESGLQNGALGIFVSMSLLGNAMMMVPSITYALIMNITAAIFIFAMLRRKQHSFG